MVGHMLWEWEGSDELYGDMAVRIVRYVLETSASANIQAPRMCQERMDCPRNPDQCDSAADDPWEFPSSFSAFVIGGKMYWRVGSAPLQELSKEANLLLEADGVSQPADR